MPAFFREALLEAKSEQFLQDIMKSNHYSQEDYRTLQSVFAKMYPRVKKEGFYEHLLLPENDLPVAKVVISLGESVDRLQDTFTSCGELSESYMCEVVGARLLVLGYKAYGEWVRDNTDFAVSKMDFIGSKNHPMEEMEEFVASVCPRIHVNEAFCMKPKQSVAFYAMLTREKTADCAHICESCDRKDCRRT